MDTKQCTKCGEIKSLTEFNKDKSRLSGYTYYCKTCFRVRVDSFHNSWGSGVYRIINKITNESYIGQSTQLRRRKCEHFTLGRQLQTTSPLLEANIRQYGKRNFDFIILNKCPVDELEQLEKQYIQELKPTLNNSDKL